MTRVERLREVSGPPPDKELAEAGSIRPEKLDPSLYINRELSWLEFNARVIAEADNGDVPLFERVKFLAIFSTNLDEFFMVRVAGLQTQLAGEIEEVPPDGTTAAEQLEAISKRAHTLVAEHMRIWNEAVQPLLQAEGVALLRPDDLDEAQQRALDERFRRDIFPVLTPLAIDPAHPFPHVRNKAINVGVLFETVDHLDPSFGVVQVPTMLPRLVRVPHTEARHFVALEDLIVRHAGDIFPQMSVKESFAFRVTRNFDIEIDDDEGEDLLLTMQAELRRRERGHAVRLEITKDAPEHSIDYLCAALGLHRQRDVYPIDGPLFFGDMPQMIKRIDRKDLRDEPFAPQYVPPLRDSADFFGTIREGDIMLHHPYESFEAVVDFLSRAAEDPNVLAIKQTLYRSGGESPIVRALQRAAEKGKEVTAVVELKARFDEESNIRWAQQLERSNVNVTYGLLGLKLHAKAALVVRREKDGLRRYVHLATGNYNQQTARLYADLSMFTAREDIAEDATSLFNLLTGYSTPARWNRMIVAPLGLHESVLGLIYREIAHAKEGRPCGITAKMNSLVDDDVIAALYAASSAGVPITLLVRGICCLRPGIKGVSENITVRAVIDRFLEHARVFHFKNGGEDEMFCSSADWMPRNFRRRVEVMFPVLDESLKDRLENEILATMAADNVKAWELRNNGAYRRVQRPEGEAVVRSQVRFVELARSAARDFESRKVLGALSARDNRKTTLEKLRRKRPNNKRKKRRD